MTGYADNWSSKPMIGTPGIYEMPDEEYHGDPCLSPSLSSGLANVLLNRSPRHAWIQHPRLGGAPPPRSKRLDLGSAIHQAVLYQSQDGIAYIDAPDWRTKAAREARDQAYIDNKVPLLEKQRSIVSGMVQEIQDHPMVQYAKPDHPHQADTNEWTECAMVWSEGKVWFRIKPDRLFLMPKRAIIYDYKTTDIAATPEGWGRRMVWEYAMQEGFYRHGVTHLLQEANHLQSIEFYFVVQETEYPYEVRTFQLPPDGKVYAAKLAQRAIKTWTYCIENNKWPGYPGRVHTVETPAWVERRLLDEPEDQ